MTNETPQIRLRQRLRRLPTSVPQDPDNIQAPNKNDTQATTINRLASQPGYSKESLPHTATRECVTQRRAKSRRETGINGVRNTTETKGVWSWASVRAGRIDHVGRAGRGAHERR